MAECTQAQLSAPGPTDNHPLWKALLTFLSLAVLPKKTPVRLVLAQAQAPASAGKPKTFTQLGLRRPLPPRACQASDSSADWGAPLKGPVFPSTARPGRPDRKHCGHPRRRERIRRWKIRRLRGLEAAAWGEGHPLIAASDPDHICTGRPGLPATPPVCVGQGNES